MWYVENVGYIDRYDQLVRREYYMSISMALKGRHDTYYIRLRDSKTDETYKWFLSEAEFVILVQDIKPYGLFSISGNEAKHIVISLGKYGYKFLELVDSVELVSSEQDEFVGKLVYGEGFLELVAVTAVDEQLSLFMLETGEYSSLFDLIMDEAVMWSGDCIYLFNKCSGPYVLAYRVKFTDVKLAKAYIGKVRMLSSKETAYIVSVDEA